MTPSSGCVSAAKWHMTLNSAASTTWGLCLSFFTWQFIRRWAPCHSNFSCTLRASWCGAKKMNEPPTNGQDCHRVYEPGSLLGASAKRVVGKCGGLISCWNPLAIIREDDKGCLFAFSIILIDSEMQISMRKRSQLLSHQSQHKSCFYCILSFGHHKSQVTWCPL